MTTLYEEVYKVDKDFADFVKKALSTQPKTEDDMVMGEDDTKSITVTFSDGYSMDIKICGVKFEEGADNRPWCEAVLFNEEGGEVACSEVSDKFFGDWGFAVDGACIGERVYRVEVVE